MPSRLLLLLLVTAASSGTGGQPLPRTETALPARILSLDLPSGPVGVALLELRKQSGVSVVDDLGVGRTTAPVKLARVGFWQAADAIARSAKGRVVPSSRDGSLHLVALTPTDRDAPTSYGGNFRLRLVRVTAGRDLDSARAGCVCTLELAWTPDVRPLFVADKLKNVEARDVRGHAIDVLDEGSGLTAVDGRLSHTVDLTLAGLPRADATIPHLAGQFEVVAPSRFLTFRFDTDLSGLAKAIPGGALRRLVQSDVVCRVDRVVLGNDRWTVGVGMEYPEGTRSLESFQAGSLVVQNQLRLISPDGKRTMVPASYVIDSVSSRRAQVSYHFPVRPGTAPNWRMTYQAPQRLLDVPVRFSFKDVPLP